jgi:1-deoxy-D-xylulose-5-phosphate synthase
MAVRYPRSPGLGVPLDTVLREIPIGESEVVRYGEDVAILALGASVVPSLEAAKELALKGIEATVVNVRFAKPLHKSLITELSSRIKHIVTVEENVLTGGFGSSVIRLLQESGKCDITVKNIGIPDEFVEHGTQAILRSKYGLDANGIARQVLKLFPDSVSNLPLNVDDKAKTTQ